MVIETLLVKDAGYSLPAVRGETRHVTEETPCTGVLAWLRDTLPGMERGTVTRHVTERTEGMSEKEVLQRWVLHDEHERIKEEKAAKEGKKARQRATSHGGH
jgi:hypothetical protein